MIDNHPLDTSLIFVTPLDADKHTTWRIVKIHAHKTTKLRMQDWQRKPRALSIVCCLADARQQQTL